MYPAEISGQKQKKFFMGEMKNALFCTPNHQRWMERLLRALPDHPVQVVVSSSQIADIYSPIHLIVDALVSVYV